MDVFNTGENVVNVLKSTDQLMIGAYLPSSFCVLLRPTPTLCSLSTPFFYFISLKKNSHLPTRIVKKSYVMCFLLYPQYVVLHFLISQMESHFLGLWHSFNFSFFISVEEISLWGGFVVVYVTKSAWGFLNPLDPIILYILTISYTISTITRLFQYFFSFLFSCQFFLLAAKTTPSVSDFIARAVKENNKIKGDRAKEIKFTPSKKKPTKIKENRNLLEWLYKLTEWIPDATLYIYLLWPNLIASRII